VARVARALIRPGTSGLPALRGLKQHGRWSIVDAGPRSAAMDERIRNLASAVAGIVGKGPDLARERERQLRKEHEEARAERRRLVEEIAAAHERILRRRLDGESGTLTSSEAAEATRALAALEAMLGLFSLRAPVPAGETAPPHVSEPDPPPPQPEPPPPAPPPPRRASWELVESSLQEWITLQENLDLFDRHELRGRCQLILARARWFQDSPEGHGTTEERKRQMRMLFGSIQQLQKDRNLPYMETLDRNRTENWEAAVRALEAHHPPIQERLRRLRAREHEAAARRRAAEVRAARQRLEGAEILREIRLFRHALAEQGPEGDEHLRRLVEDALSCLGPGDPELQTLLLGHEERLPGPRFEALRLALRERGLGAALAPPPAAVETAPTQEADRDEALHGAFRVLRGLILGGTVRPEARDLLHQHLGFTELDWWDGATVHRLGAGLGPRLASADAGRVIVLADRLPEHCREVAQATVPAERLVLVRGGQSIDAILRALAERGPAEPRPRIDSVDAALVRAFQEHPQALAACFNSTSEEKGYPYEDPAAVYRALVFLATTYRDARSGRAPCPNLAERCFAACGLHYQAHQSASTVGRFVHHYTANYKGQRFVVEEHLSQGTNRDPRHSIRIAFHYHREDDVVILGYLGQHQRTRVS
jgi:hypothetical protein